MKITLLHKNAKIPFKAYPSDAGYDLYSIVDAIIEPHTFITISTGISITDFPTNYYARIAPRSGLAVKHGINVGAGVVDPGYTGEIKVCLFNHSDEQFIVYVGDRIAQLIFTQFTNVEFEVIDKEKTDGCEGQDRGDRGFGSSNSLG